MDNSHKLKVLSLFSGCGGLDIPFSNDIYEIICAYDNDPAAIQCLKYNLACNAKVMDVSSEAFEQDIEKYSKVDIILGGFPCQGFSKSGPKKQEDPRNNLYLSMLRAVELLRPTIFIAENVDGMVQNFEGTFVNQIVSDFQQIGYKVEYKILNAVNFGVAQYRRRILFVGICGDKTGSFHWPEPTHKGTSRNGEFKTKWDVLGQTDLFKNDNLYECKTISDELSNIIDIATEIPDHVFNSPVDSKDLAIMNRIGEGQKLCNVRFSDTSVYTWQIPDVFGEITDKEIRILETIGKNRRKKENGSIPNGNPLSVSVISELIGQEILESELINLVNKNYLKTIDTKFDLKGAMFCSGLYKRPNWNEPSPTVLTVFDSPRYMFHPKITRPFTIRECARLQSFPDSFEFLASGISIKDAYRLIGNAVPPKLAKAIEGSVYNYFKKKNVI